MSLASASSHLHPSLHRTCLKLHDRTSQASGAHTTAPSPNFETATPPDLTSPSPPKQSAVSTQSAPFGDTVASTASSSIEDWLENTLRETSTSTPKHLTSLPDEATTHLLKHKRKLSLDCYSRHGKLRRLPLKKRYLDRHTAAADFLSMSQVHQGEEDVSTESKWKSSDKTALTGKLGMQKHGILHNHANFQRYPEFQATVKRPFEQNRHYPVRPQSVEMFEYNLNYYKDGNEESFKHELLGSIIKREFEVLVRTGENGEDPIYRPSIPRLEGIVSKYSARLRQGYLPHIYDNPSYDTKLVAKRLQEEGMFTPEPDGIWGFDPDKMPQCKFEPQTQELMTLCKKMHWPFFVMQCKVDASYEETLNQARRDGAAIVHVALTILRRAGYSVDKTGPNFDTYIYSMTMSNHIAQWWVHWTEIDTDGSRKFHMNPVLPLLPLEGENLLSKLRDPTHTILEWGLQTRMPEVRERYPVIAAADTGAENRALQRKSERSGSGPMPVGSTRAGSKRSHSKRDSEVEQG